MDISQLSKKTGIASSKIRYYEKIGLINSTGRSGLKRTFSKDVIQKLSFIALAQSSGFKLEEILSMLSFNNKFKLDRNLINTKIEEIEENIKKLKKMKKGLDHLNNCSKADHFECSNFIKILNNTLVRR